MNVKLRIFIIFSLLSSCTFAGPIYIGGTLGLASLMDKESTDNPIRDVHYLSAVGVLGGALIGYDFNLCDQWRLALEGFINSTNLNLSDNQNYSPQTSYKVKMRYNTGIRILPGYELTAGTVGHLILGYSNGNFNIHDNGNYGIINKNFSKNGFQAGLGMGTLLSDHLSIRADMLYTIYSSQTSYGVTTSIPPASQAYHNRLSTLEGDLSLIYKV